MEITAAGMEGCSVSLVKLGLGLGMGEYLSSSEEELGKSPRQMELLFGKGIHGYDTFLK